MSSLGTPRIVPHSFFSVAPPAPSKVRQANKYVNKGGKHPWKTPKGTKNKRRATTVSKKAAKYLADKYARPLDDVDS